MVAEEKDRLVREANESFVYVYLVPIVRLEGRCWVVLSTLDGAKGGKVKGIPGAVKISDSRDSTTTAGDIRMRRARRGDCGASCKHREPPLSIMRAGFPTPRRALGLPSRQGATRESGSECRCKIQHHKYLEQPPPPERSPGMTAVKSTHFIMHTLQVAAAIAPLLGLGAASSRYSTPNATRSVNFKPFGNDDTEWTWSTYLNSRPVIHCHPVL